jgi:hypothetical protein
MIWRKKLMEGSLLNDSGVVAQNIRVVFSGAHVKICNFVGMGVQKCT